MDAIKSRRNRDRVLRYIYENCADSPFFGMDIDEVAKALGLTYPEEMGAVHSLLYNQGLLNERCPYGSMALNIAGQAEAERLGPAVLMRDPPPSPAVQHIHIGNATNSNVLIAGAHSHQHATNTVTQLHQILNEIERCLATAPIGEPQRTEAADLIAALRGPIKGAIAKAAGTALSNIVSPISADLGKQLLDWFS